MKAQTLNPHTLTTPLNPETETEKEKESEETRAGKPNADALQGFKSRMTSAIGNGVTPEIRTQAQEEAAAEKGRT